MPRWAFLSWPGREFDQHERENPRAAILSRKAAEAAFPGENPVGRVISHWGRNYTIVGVAADARINDLKRDVAVYYLPYWDFPPFTAIFLVRSEQPAQALAPAMRQVIWSIDSDVSIPTLVSLDAQARSRLRPNGFKRFCFRASGFAALLLASARHLRRAGLLGGTAHFGVWHSHLHLEPAAPGWRRLVMAGALIPVVGGVVLGLLLAAGRGALDQQPVV